jgi:GAF domain-containing protein
MDQSETPANHPDLPSEVSRLEARVSELQRERDQLVAIVDILQEISASLHFVDILQAIARKLGESFGLDRCSIFLTGEASDVRLVASYEDPTIRNLVVDLERYPELRRAFESGETVFVPDAVNDPMFAGVKSLLDLRNVRSIIVVPIRWRGAVIGAIFLRTERDAETFSESDVRFCQVVASLTAKALHNAHRFEAALEASQDRGNADRRSELERVALLAFIRRLLERYGQSQAHIWAEAVLPKASDDELNRLVSVTMQVLEAEAKG